MKTTDDILNHIEERIKNEQELISHYSSICEGGEDEFIVDVIIHRRIRQELEKVKWFIVT
jgi:hypothetical protein